MYATKVLQLRVTWKSIWELFIYLSDNLTILQLKILNWNNSNQMKMVKLRSLNLLEMVALNASIATRHYPVRKLQGNITKGDIRLKMMVPNLFAKFVMKSSQANIYGKIICHSFTAEPRCLKKSWKRSILPRKPSCAKFVWKVSDIRISLPWRQSSLELSWLQENIQTQGFPASAHERATYLQQKLQLQIVWETF